MQCALTAEEMQLIHMDYHTLVRMVLQLEARVKALEEQHEDKIEVYQPTEYTGTCYEVRISPTLRLDD